MEMNRRDIMRALAAMPVLAASSTGARAQKAAINYWHHFTSTTEFKGLERVMALFKKAYPDIAVTQENIPNPEYMVGEFQLPWGSLAAGGIISILPVMILFAIVQRAMVRGLTAGAVKS